MKKLKKCLALFVAGVCLLSSLTGCRKAASVIVTSMVQWNMDAVYLGKYDETWIKMVETTKEQCEEDYLTGLEAEAEYFCYYWGITDDYVAYTDLNEEFRSAVVELLKEIYSHSKYEIQSAVAQGSDSYAVKVIVEPIDIMDQVNNSYDTASVLSAFWEKYTDEDINNMTDEEYIAFSMEYGNIILYLVHEQLDNIGYMDAKTQTVQVELVNDTWTINNDDFIVFDSYIIYYP